MASVTLTDGTDYLFYYNTDSNIACLWGTDNGVFSNTTVQPTANVTIKASTNGPSPLAATAWENDAGALKEVSF